MRSVNSAFYDEGAQTVGTETPGPPVMPSEKAAKKPVAKRTAAKKPAAKKRAAKRKRAA